MKFAEVFLEVEPHPKHHDFRILENGATIFVNKAATLKADYLQVVLQGEIPTDAQYATIRSFERHGFQVVYWWCLLERAICLRPG